MSDVDGDGTDDVVYMLVDGATDDSWHLIVRDGETGQVKADVGQVWIWSIVDLDQDGISELIYTPTREKRPPTHCDLRVGRLEGDAIAEFAVLDKVRPVLMNSTLPPTAHTIADEGLLDVLHTDVNGDRILEFFYAEKSESGNFEDRLYAACLTSDGSLRRTWSFARRGHRLNLVFANNGEVRVRDLTAGEVLTVSGGSKVIHHTDLGRPGGLVTMPIVVDLNGDGRNEVVVQNAAGEITALRVVHPGTTLETLWSVPGVSMNRVQSLCGVDYAAVLTSQLLFFR